MEQTEINIGNYFYHKNIPVKIVELNLCHCTICDKDGNVIPLINYNELEPIPVTYKFLKKNDFLESMFVLLYFKLKNKELCTVTSKYVHELQNILWAFKIDKKLIIE